METRLRVQARAAPSLSFMPVRSTALQRKCSCGGTPGSSGECEACREKREKGMLQRKATHPSSFNPHPSEVPPIVHEVLRSPGQPLDAQTRAFMEPRFGHEFSQVRVHSDASNGLKTPPLSSTRYVGARTEAAGEATCDPDQGKVVMKINYKNFPICMADCVYAHEKAHADFEQAECAKVSAAAKTAKDAIDKAKANPTEDNMKKAEQAAKDFEKAKQDYDKWMDQNCVADESQAYQAGIDKCNTAEVKKQCADEKATTQYEEFMKQWEKFKKTPPNCAQAVSPAPSPPSGTPAPPPSSTPAPKGRTAAVKAIK
jgi:Domain of unknown function (DUF4157)